MGKNSEAILGLLNNQKKAALMIDDGVGAEVYRIVIAHIRELEAANRWHPYPAEKPEKEGTYLVQVPAPTDMYVDSWVDDKWYECYDTIAWRELPAPYKEEIK